MLSDPYGSFLPALWYHDLRDLWQGNAARVNARWGRLKPPGEKGRLVWIASGADHASVRLGAALTGAIREMRLDLRLVFTFEYEYPELLHPLIELDRCGHGYAPCDHRGAIKRAWQRFQPFGTIYAGTLPRRNLARASSTLKHVLAVGTAAAAPLRVEQAYPASEKQAQSWRATPQAPIADLLTLVTTAQVEPTFRTLVNGAAERHLWWWHGNDADAASRFATAFLQALPQDLLFVSGVADLPQATQRLSHWQHQALPVGVVLADEAKWLPAVAACCTAAHLVVEDNETLWQALAGGNATSCADRAYLPKRELAEAVTICTDAAAVLRHWQECRDNTHYARNLGDAARRAFWQERRLAAEVSNELLERVFNWD
jgi:hypothetical protein